MNLPIGTAPAVTEAPMSRWMTGNDEIPHRAHQASALSVNRGEVSPVAVLDSSERFPL